jgi:hypothetical protein
MRVTQMTSKAILWLMVGGGLPLVALGQNAPQNVLKIAPVPSDPLELVSGQIPVAVTAESRKAVVQLLAQARNNYSLRGTRQGYDLKISFAVDSLGQTDYDGAWQMEDVFVPGQGLHWTAQKEAEYTLTGIAVNGQQYQEGTSELVPLRLEEARGILLHPLPSDAYLSRESIRTAPATFRDASVTCVLLSNSKSAVIPAVGRGWEESEECIDPQTGLLQMHSEAPGRYVVYDYSNAPQLGGHTLARTVTVSEAGRIVSKITVEKLDQITGADPSRFVPSDEMKARGQSVEMAAMTKVSRIHGRGSSTPAMIVRVVCVFGMVTPSGQLVEAHSLQPSDPNSQAAVEDARGINFAPSKSDKAPPRQHFVFVIEKFASSR